MIILGIDTSCDDTSASVVKDGNHILSSVISSQIPFHEKHGGIVPEIAARKHTELINYVIRDALDTASLNLDSIDAVAVTDRPGLIGSLIVGIAAAKSVSWIHGIPLIPVNHMQAHLYAPQLSPDWNIDRFVGLIVSGGHTMLVETSNRIDMTVHGRTIDDAAGEALDKVAKLMNIGYPGGPVIQAFAEKCTGTPVKLPRPMLHEGYNFSFSGLKTAARLAYQKIVSGESGHSLVELAAGFQEAVIDVLQYKTIKLVKETGLSHILVTGGVAANTQMREVFEQKADRNSFTVHFPPPVLCTDNAAMIAGLGYHLYQRGITAGLDLNPQANILPRGVK